jgi:hypothetical protein
MKPADDLQCNTVCKKIFRIRISRYFENTNQKFQQNIRILAKDTTLSAYFDL